MPIYPGYVEGWDVETSHPIEETEEGPICEICLNGVAPAIAFATDWGATAFQAQSPGDEGTMHTIVVRQVVAP